MPPSQGLSKRTIRLQAATRWTTALAVPLVVGLQMATVVWASSQEWLITHTITILLIALVTYGILELPMAPGLLLSGLAIACTFAAWVKTASSLLGLDAWILVGVVGIAMVQRRHRMLRLTRLKQQLSDLNEELYLKTQALRLNEQTVESLRHKLNRYEQLQAVAEQLSRLVDLDAISQLIVDRAFELIGKSHVCLLFLVDKERQDLALYASKKTAEIPVIRNKQGDQFDRYVLRTQRPLLVNDVRRDFRFSEANPSERSLGSVIACPLLVDEGPEGVLRLDSPQPGTYTQDDLRFLDILLDLVDTALANARLFAQTQQLAITDGLTGLYRRQPFMEQLTREVSRAGRSREPFSLLMLDIDDFKRYNDTFGHTAGDVLLKRIADLVRSSVPPDGMCARYGGEEFAILLPRASQKEGLTIARRIRQAVETQARTASPDLDRPVTVSLGVTSFPQDAQSELELIRHADQGLYRAKRAGKNRVWPS